MSKRQELEALQSEKEDKMARGGTDNKDEKRERVIRIRQWSYNELRAIGSMGMDFDDVVTKLILFWKKEHGKSKNA
jgi:hypothetical protein